MYRYFSLVIRPLGVWNVYVPAVFHVSEEVYYYETKGQVEPAEVAGDEAMRKLVELCKRCEPEAFYDFLGKKRFKSPEDFFAKADKSMQDGVKEIADKRLKRVLEAAFHLRIKLFFRKTSKEELLKKNELYRATREFVPLMIFKKVEEGIHYSLRFKFNEEEILVPSEHQLLLFAENPGVVSIDNQLYFLPENFNGKLLLPFLEKSSTFIPHRMQNEYFRRFIHKNTYKREILAEGFDIVEACSERKCRLTLDKNVYGESFIGVTFVYDNVAFDKNDERQLFVRLEEVEGNFRFIKFVRDKEWESVLLRMLGDEWNMPETGKVSDCVNWLKAYRESLNSAGIDFVQSSTNRYYIGGVSVAQSTSWNNDWFQMHVEIRLDNGVVIPFFKLKDAILRGVQEFVMEDGSVFLIPEEWFARYAGVMMFGRVDGKLLSLHRSQIPVVTVMEEPDERGVQVEDRNVPRGLRANLRHYQQEGFEWLYHHFISQTGCCLSDDMGLGKTVQTIALMLKYKETCQRVKVLPRGNVQRTLFSEEEMSGIEANTGGSGGIPFETILVVSPASVVYNWRNEIRRFAPGLMVNEYVGTIDKRRRKQEALMRWDVVLTTYQTLRNDIEYFSRFSFGMVVFDESQYFKNRNSHVYQSVARLCARHRLALSGTPLENSLGDLWSLMNVLNPRLLGSYQAFQDNFINPISRNMEDKKTEILRTLISPYFLKRSKEDVLPDLPPRQDELVVCEMSPEQQQLYDEELSRTRNFLLSSRTTGDDTSASNSILVLAAITRLRQIASHPLLAGKEGATSGKFFEIFTRLEELHDTNHKVLIFSEYVSLLKLVAGEMENRGWTYEMLTGETSNREVVINRFMANPTCCFFLISLKAGGVGLNLTNADYVFLLDPWWNRAAEEQAISRSHRIGQQRSVFVYRFISRGTLEEQILELQDRKQSLIEAVMPFIKPA